MESVLDALKEEITRRRALLITPFAFAGLVAISSRKGDRSVGNVSANDSASEVVIVPLTDKGQKLAPVTLQKLIRSDAEWRKLLDAEQYYVTRHQGTDTAFTGTYYQLHDPGLFRCVCCDNALFSSDAKFDSGTGWPSFTAPVAEENIYTHRDVSMFLERVEVACKRCDAHLGHVFTDGPEPTYLRYCINESSLRFVRYSG
jgi:peptide-methionine (R)-S-oxide reductase